MAQESTGKNSNVGNTKLRCRHWCFTLNNYVEQDIQLILNSFEKYTFQEEVGASGTKHLQGVVSYKNPRNFNHIKGILPKAHIEKCRSIKHSIKYCSKKETRSGRVFSNQITIVKDPLNNKKYYDWQADIIKILESEPDDRKIYWFWSEKGNVGKTSFIKHLLINRPYCTYVSGKAGDMLFALSQVLEDNPNINTVLMNIPRCVEHISYNGLEQIKDGLIFNSKYESGYKMFNPPHIIVMANTAPNLYKMSEDRWIVKEIQSPPNPPT